MFGTISAMQPSTEQYVETNTNQCELDPRVGIEVSAVIPCLNEATTIGICIQKAFASFSALGIRGEVVVADNGSVDDSVKVAERLGGRVVHESTKGYGAALSRGIREARGNIVIIGDADDSYDWAAIGPFIAKIREGYDLVMGNRFRGGIMRGAMPALHRYLGNPVLSWIGRIAFHTDVGDFHCGMRAFTRAAFFRMGTTSSGMEFATEMVANAACLGLRISEIPTKLYPDKRNRPPHLRSFRDGWRHLRFILTYAPDYLYLIPGVSLFLVGLFIQCLLIRGTITISGISIGANTLALGSLLTLVGFNILNLGVLAKALMAHRYAGLNTRLVGWIHSRFTLEAGLMIGLALVFLGIGIDVATAIEWLRTFLGPMEKTINLSFVATTILVLGVNLMFSSFLLHMILLVNSESKWVGGNFGNTRR
jgi:glycosyltransferase involved in cell wall biosynthesis